MKTRAGFVSNSSSSSFILVFDKKPESIAAVFDALFKGLPEGMVTTPWSEPGEGVGRLTAAEDVWNQISDQDSMTLEQVTDEFRNSWDSDFPETDWSAWAKADEKQKQQMWKEQDAECDRVAKEKATAFWQKNKGKFLCSVCYHDNEGPFGSIMEHGDAFENIEYKRFSHH